MRLRRAILYVKDFDRMRAFYGGTLGLKPMAETLTEGWVEFEGGFALHAIPASIAERIEIASPPSRREGNPVKLSFAVDDVGFERTRLESLGVAVVARRWGGCDGVDPEGNVFGIEGMGPG
jgi:catechol 2,3-dioxygenase-like lactoylglutathione lyase family enzyme